MNMANQMGTTAAGGTTVNGMLTGLDNYLESADGVAGNAYWNTYLLLSALPPNGGVGGPAFWATLQSELASGKGILLAIRWPNGAPGGYDLPENYFPDPYPNSPMGHAVTMVGYDVTQPANLKLSILDPANNPAGNAGTQVHVWPAVAPDTYTVIVNPSDLSIGVNNFNATIYAAVITSPVPEPSTLILLGISVMGLLAYAWRRWNCAV